ncbi:undecaprenyl-phosphate galactosephosphotransferase [Actibacterium atlanticum]|uniref:Undecaprenyl-phosphate galactosephosphotransferase n=1 Tax=Actibacterium atlanticum TaxID=1461693 RepID=A0A058ZMS5_9RHOB|nr:sugar transferase [Actibacterium atlanticum]KCV82833.1 undecaprenyl-phosphate galactosephosphotransferase [Actibacterium atlanticum]
MKNAVFDFFTNTTEIHAPQVAKTNLYTRFGKRAFDLAFAIAILPLVAPLVLILWALVRLDGGPGLYSQKRVGLDRKQFDCWKLRTMVVDAEAVLTELCEKDPEIAREWHQNQKLAKDPRITKVGRFLRATSLDELPQILNILTGDMSFVGPRPFMSQQMQMYEAAGGRSYFDMRPGITGCWQVVGRGKTQFSDRVHFDDMYHSKLSFKYDLTLILKTVGVVVKGTGT